MAGIWDCIWSPEFSATLAENFGDGATLQRTSGSPSIVTDALVGGARVLRVGPTVSGTASVEKDGPETDELTWGMRVRLIATTQAAVAILLLDSGGSTIFNFVFTTAGVIQARRGTTVLGEGGVIPTGDYVYVRFSVLIHDSAGAVKVMVGSDTVIDVSGVDTKNTAGGNITRMRFDATNLANWAFRDLRIVEGFDNFRPPVSVLVAVPDGDISPLGGVPSSGSDGYAMEDEALADGDTTYNTFSNNGDRNHYTFEDLDITGDVDVEAVALFHTCKAPVSGPSQIAPELNIGGNDHAGDALDPGDTAFRTVGYCWSENPETSAAWTGSDVDALIGGPKLVG